MKIVFKFIALLIIASFFSHNIFCFDKAKLAKELTDVIEEILPDDQISSRVTIKDDVDMMSVSLSEQIDKRLVPDVTALLAAHPSYTNNKQLVDKYIKAQQALDGFGKYLIQEMKNKDEKDLVERLEVIEISELPEHPIEEPEMPVPVPDEKEEGEEELPPEVGAEIVGTEEGGSDVSDVVSLAETEEELPPEISEEG